jgi:hypothetical protein
MWSRLTGMVLGSKSKRTQWGTIHGKSGRVQR